MRGSKMSHKVNFTKAFLLEAKPTQGERLVLWDAKTPGLQCRISHTGNKTFSVFKRMKGYAAERITLGKFPQMSIEQARAEATKINAAIYMGHNPAEIRRINKDELTLKDLFTLYLEEYSKKKNKSYKSDESVFRLYLEKSLGNKKISKITMSNVSQLHTKISIQVRGGQEKRVTANRVLALISSMFNWAIKRGYCKDNPAKGVQKNPEKARDRFLQPEELSKFFEAVNQETNKTIKDFILISLYTGARRSNVVTMKWEDISMQFKIWRIPNTKNNDPVIVPLIDEAIQVLESRKGNKSDYVFPGEGEMGHLIDPKKGWARVLERSGLKDLRLHDLRRTLGSWQAIMGSSTLIIGKSLGHRSQKATEVYARLNIEPVRKSIQVAARAMIKSASMS